MRVKRIAEYLSENPAFLYANEFILIAKGQNDRYEVLLQGNLDTMAEMVAKCLEQFGAGLLQMDNAGDNIRSALAKTSLKKSLRNLEYPVVDVGFKMSGSGTRLTLEEVEELRKTVKTFPDPILEKLLAREDAFKLKE